MRLCDLNKALEELCKYCACGSYESCENRCVEFRNISNIATIDAAPVVRCVNCIHYGAEASAFDAWTPFCLRHKLTTFPDDFCSYGERKDGGG